MPEALGNWGPLPSILILAVLFCSFARSLRPGREPIVVRLAGRARGGVLDPAIRRYARQVTVFWTGYFALALATVLAAWLSGNGRLAVMAGILAGLPMSLALLVGEYGLRRLVLRHHRHMSLGQFLRFMASPEVRSLVGGGAPTVGQRHD